ncbi:MAG: hypothetical protein ACT4QC_17695 [Planctomycetaceae bacterium]
MPHRTKNGCCPWECISALQKFVRRGMELEAIQAAAELSETHLALMLNRLRVIAHEDIGLANLQAPLLTRMWTEQAWDWHKQRNGAWRLALANVILLLCRSPKSREADHFQCVGFDAFERNIPLAIPDFALCKHTRRGRKLGRGVRHFREVGTILHPPTVPDKYENQAYAIWERQEASLPSDPAPPSPAEQLTIA